jgi:hypothetical protein
LANAQAICEQGACIYECSQGNLDANRDLTMPNSDGCECQPTSAEVCDNLDNDCNGVADDMSALSQICPEIPFASPVCDDGGCTYTCLPQRVDVNGDLGEPGSDGCECLITGDEVCDNQDNDCDGQTDEIDAPELCPASPFAAYACQAGTCIYECLPQYVDVNNNLSEPQNDGCECMLTGQEVCDGIDNDCNGQTDDQDPSYTPYLCALQLGVCEGSTQRCQAGSPLVCEAADYLTHDPAFTSTPLQPELLCDDLDNNCDGDTDELCCADDQPRDLVQTPLNPLQNQFLPTTAIDPTGTYAFFAWQEDPLPSLNTPHNQGIIRYKTINLSTKQTVNERSFQDDDPIENYHPSSTWDGTGFALVWVNKQNHQRIEWRRATLANPIPEDAQINVGNNLEINDPAIVGMGDGTSLLAWSQAGVNGNLNPCPSSAARRCIAYTTVLQDGSIGPIRDLASSDSVQARFPQWATDGQGNALLAWYETSDTLPRISWSFLQDQNQTFNITATSVDIRILQNNPSVIYNNGKYHIIFKNFSNGNLQLVRNTLNASGEPELQAASLVTSAVDKDFPQITANSDGFSLYWTQPNSIYHQAFNFDFEPLTQPSPLFSSIAFSFAPLSAVTLPTFGSLLVTSTDDGLGEQKLDFSIRNPQGDRLCIAPQ